MDDKKRIEVIKELWVPSIKVHMEVGWTEPVERRLTKFLPSVNSSGDLELIAFFRQASDWLDDAKRKEKVLGKDCLLDRGHRYYKNFLQHRQEFSERKRSHGKRAA